MRLLVLHLLLFLLGSTAKAGECRGSFPRKSSGSAPKTKRLSLTFGTLSSSQEPQTEISYWNTPTHPFFKAIVVSRNTEACVDPSGEGNPKASGRQRETPKVKDCFVILQFCAYKGAGQEEPGQHGLQEGSWARDRAECGKSEAGTA